MQVPDTLRFSFHSFHWNSIKLCSCTRYDIMSYPPSPGLLVLTTESMCNYHITAPGIPACPNNQLHTEK